LRAPVRAIEGFSALVLGKAAGQVDAETLNRLRRIRDNAQRMGMLIDDLLRLSRVSQRELDRRDFDLTALATEIVNNLRRADPSRHMDVTVQPGMATNGDPALVHLVLENLIGNAWKFTGRTESARIEVGEQPDSDGPVYFVRDNGAGFDMQYADKLFQAFQRLHHREDFEGTGIGLSIVQRVVGKHGGRIWADARPGEGAVFYFTLG
jgi:light-regulated signal transduction histidine kinase (bacteriophytochrome)